MYQVLFEKEAQKALRKIPKHEQIRILGKIESLSSNPKPDGIKSLQGKWGGYYRIRSGDYRVIYEIIEKKVVILIVKIGSRGSIYER